MLTVVDHGSYHLREVAQGLFSEGFFIKNTPSGVVIVETQEFLKAKKEVARTAPGQIKKGLKEALNGVC